MIEPATESEKEKKVRNKTMGRYGSCISINGVCKTAVEEAKEILKPYHVSDEDVEVITNTITEAYFQFWKSCASSRAQERVFEELHPGFLKEPELFQKYIQYTMEEEQAMPFDLPDDDEWGEEDDEL